MTGVGERVVTYRCWLRLMVCCTSLLFVASAWSQPAPAAAQALPPGPGHDIAAAKCVSCHDATRLKSPGYSREGWKEWPSPGGPDSQPYGITVLHDVIWYSETGVRPNTLVRFDPRSEKFQSWAIPSGGGVVRNMMPTRDGGLVLAESGAGKLAMVHIQAP